MQDKAQALAPVHFMNGGHKTILVIIVDLCSWHLLLKPARAVDNYVAAGYPVDLG